MKPARHYFTNFESNTILHYDSNYDTVRGLHPVNVTSIRADADSPGVHAVYFENAAGVPKVKRSVKLADTVLHHLADSH